MTAFLTGLARRAEDFLIPPLCVVCDGLLDAGGADRWFCPDCLDALRANNFSRDPCPRCSRNRRRGECTCEFAWDFPFESVFSVYDYDETLRAAAHHIKYKGKSRLARHVGLISAPLLPGDFLAGADVVVPVPLHKTRQRRRGYNQAEFFARGLLEAAERRALLRTDLLVRVRNTGTQTRLDREGRLENLLGAFAVDPGRADGIRGKRVVLVDDVLTTGATAEACTDELLRAGCASVRVLAMAIGVNR
jgi:ComF family protein